MEYKGKNYPTRTISASFLDDEEDNDYVIGGASLSRAMLDNNGEPLDDEASEIDNSIFFYVSDELIDNGTDQQIIDYISSNL